MANPYLEAMEFITLHESTSTAVNLAKLILSLYHPKHSFGIGECVSNFDDERMDLALRMIKSYGEHGESEELREVGHKMFKQYPDLIELSDAASDAKYQIREKWRKENEAKYAAADEG